ncbi:transketolase [Paenibacillus methanolicus]|uniref:Transketolase n=1 Tax=Paenibacillus methanolicus TaxID=582686 RepID=A0A5S5C038_9BACL|nr:transketolase [Paenibacillus methanolicus]TYP71812.1 transketolase [Paenibacillus methanolicus]
MTVTQKSIDQLSIDTIRTLAIDAIEKANSGHPGMPMGAAPMGYQLFAKSMRHNPANPSWINRDRFVLSAGHGSMLLYSLLHLSGYDLPIEELHNFRQWGSKTPGHPEFGHTAGVDATTGPLGQGVAMAVGMAMAETQLGATYNQDNFNVIDHFTYAICGDGDLMEGVASEAASLAAHLKLGKLVVLYDSNDITLDGEANLSFSENVQGRFEAYGWQVIRVEDGNDLDALAKAVSAAQADLSRPTLIEVKTVIGYGSPNKGGKGGHAGPHGSPLGVEETKLTKQFYAWEHDEAFTVPAQVREHFAAVKASGEQANAAWDSMFASYKEAHPALAAQFETAVNGQLPEGWDRDLPVYTTEDKPVSTRVASGNALNGLAKNVPNLVGGSADLESSTMTHLKGLPVYKPGNYSGRNIYFGVREFGMAAAMNGISLHGGLRIYGATFFVFTDYLRPAVRLSALMKQPVVYVLTHDSIAVGEDGPTHEPIEQLASLRIIPDVTVLRPADANETSAAWAFALENQSKPVALVLTRQNLPILEGTNTNAREGIKKGAYVVSEAAGDVQAQIIATGSEVQLAVDAQKALAAEGIHVRVISMPSWDLFEAQPQSYKDSVILPEVKARLAVEMASPFGWERYVGDKGAILGINTFGASAPGNKVIAEYGFTVENVVSKVKGLL